MTVLEYPGGRKPIQWVAILRYKSYRKFERFEQMHSLSLKETAINLLLHGCSWYSWGSVFRDIGASPLDNVQLNVINFFNIWYGSFSCSLGCIILAYQRNPILPLWINRYALNLSPVGEILILLSMQ